MKCPVCDSQQPSGSPRCRSCGAIFGGFCTNCGSPVLAGFRFCGSCGEILSVAKLAEAEVEAAGERRQVTILFADLVGFSTLAEFMDPEELQALLGDIFENMADLVKARDGFVEKFVGDAVMAIFGAPRAHEDDPLRAVNTALAMLDLVRSRSDQAHSSLQLRIGINSGLVVSGPNMDMRQVGVLGDAVNVAARLQNASGPNQILVTESIWRRIQHDYETERVGSLQVKGRRQPVEAYSVLGPRPAKQRRLTPFVGRHEEMSLLELLWSNAARGNAHVVSVVGEPGVGKTRLLAEFATPSVGLPLRVACESETMFGVFLQIIDGALGRSPANLHDLEILCKERGLDDGIQPLLAAFLGFSDAPPAAGLADEQRKRQVFGGVWQFLQATARRQPTLIVLDDLHMADRSSLELLDFILERLSNAPLVMILAYRPGFHRIEGVSVRSSHTRVHVEPLIPEESLALARGYLAAKELPDDLEELVTERAEGNPFFIEELLQVLIDLGALFVEGGVAVLADRSLDIPETVQGTILARIDRQPLEQRLLLQYAAVIGQRFSAELLGKLTKAADVERVLYELADAQLVVLTDQQDWAFKHALIQEVVYETLLKRRRRALHSIVAEELENDAGNDPDILQSLADHYRRAGNLAKARHYALAAGDAALERMGYTEAKERYEVALARWGRGDEQGRVELQEKLGWAALMAGHPRPAKTALIEAASAWEALGEIQRAAGALARLGRVYFFTAEMEKSANALQRAVELLEPAGPTPELVRAYVWRSIVFIPQGAVHDALQVIDQGLKMATALKLDGARAQLLTSRGFFETAAADARGFEHLREALELATATGDGEAIGRAYLHLAIAHFEFCRLREGVVLARQGRKDMRRLGAGSFEWFIVSREVEMLAELGNYIECESMCKEILAQQRDALEVHGIFASRALALTMLRTGRYAEARHVLDEMLPLARQMGGSLFLTPALTLDAEIEEAQGNLAVARRTIEEAIAVTLDSEALAHRFPPMVTAARLLPPKQVRRLLDFLPETGGHPAFDARALEARATVENDAALHSRAAELYATMELPFEEARCRLESGEFEQAVLLMQSFGLDNGPLAIRAGELGALSSVG